MKPYYQDDSATIYLGDCMEILPELPEVDLVLTDPPYLAKDIGRDKKLPLINGTLSEVDYSKFCKEWFSLCLEKTERIVFTPGIVHIWEYPQAKWVMCWNKPGAINFNKFGGFNAWEPILVYGKMAKGKGIPLDVFTFPSNNFSTGPEIDHPCPKNPLLWKKLIEMFTEKGDVILDPMGGAGTTSWGCKILGRKSIVIEIEEKFCEIIVTRLKQEVLQF